MRPQLKKARKNAGYTQRQIADILGVSQQTVSKHESAVITPNHFRLIREYERVLGVEAEVLFPDVFG